jgi:hypothetical protein
MHDRIAQRDQAAEADAAEKDGTIAELVDQETKCRNLIVLTDEKLRLVGCALAKKIERRDAKVSRNQSVAIGAPQFGILREPVHQHIGRGIVVGTVELVADPVGAVGKEGHRATRQEILLSYPRSRGEESLELYQGWRRRRA